MNTTHTYTVTDGPKMLRETLCLAQTHILHASMNPARARNHAERLGRLIDECDRKRPIGNDGNHDDRHTAECGCEDVATPTPERVTLTDAERLALMDAALEEMPNRALSSAIEQILTDRRAAWEAEVRAQVKADILAEVVHAVSDDTVRAYNRGLYAAARIAGGDA